METRINPDLSVDSPIAAAAADPVRDALYRKAMLRFMPLLCLCLVAAYLDRVNVGFAKLTMLDDLGFSNTVYGFGAGIFFFGYFLFEVPSNLIMKRVGAHFAPFGKHAFRSYWFELWAFYESKRGPSHTWERETTGKSFTAAALT